MHRLNKQWEMLHLKWKKKKTDKGKLFRQEEQSIESHEKCGFSKEQRIADSMVLVRRSRRSMKPFSKQMMACFKSTNA